MKSIALAAFCAGLLLGNGALEAATVQTLQPKLAVNTGSGFKYTQRNTRANPGDQVMATPGGLGRIVYDDGCATEVKPGRVYRVREVSPCKGGAWKTTDYLIAGGAAAGLTLGIIALSDDDDDGQKKTKKSPKPAVEASP